jgi:hypothetical protein
MTMKKMLGTGRIDKLRASLGASTTVGRSTYVAAATIYDRAVRLSEHCRHAASLRFNGRSIDAWNDPQLPVVQRSMLLAEWLKQH